MYFTKKKHATAVKTIETQLPLFNAPCTCFSFALSSEILTNMVPMIENKIPSLNRNMMLNSATADVGGRWFTQVAKLLVMTDLTKQRLNKSTSASFLAEIPVRSPRFFKLLKKCIFWIKVSKTCFIYFWKEKHWSRPIQLWMTWPHWPLNWLPPWMYDYNTE